MLPRERLALILVKVARAHEHLRALGEEVDAYISSNPYVISTKRDPDSRRVTYFLRSAAATPSRLSAIAGDVIHNLRSALDHLAYQLVWVGSGTAPSSHVYFPIADNHADYVKRRRRYMDGATPTAIAAIDALAPYKGGSDLLWKLHRLDNVDKHRVLIAAGSAFQSVNVGPQMLRELRKAVDSSTMASIFTELPAMDLFLKPADRMFPLKEGDELYTDLSDAVLDNSLRFVFELALGEQGVVFGEPIVGTLALMADTVERILPTFEAHLG